MIQLTEDVFAVPVPYTANHLDSPEQDAGAGVLQYDYANRWVTETLLPGVYQFLFSTNTVDEEKAKMVVGELCMFLEELEVWHDYTGVKEYGFDTATESFKSLLASKGIKEGNYAIVELIR